MADRLIPLEKDMINARGVNRPAGPLLPRLVGNIGREVTLNNAGVVAQDVVSVTTDDEVARDIKITISVSPFTSATPRRVQAGIRFGSGGMVRQFLIDIMRGTTITLPASMVRVDLVSGENGADFRAGAWASFGKGPPFTSRGSNGAVAAAPGTLNFNVWAGNTDIFPFLRNMWFETDNINDTFIVEALNSVGGVEYQAIKNPGERMAPMPVDGSIQTLRIVNLAGAINRIVQFGEFDL